MRIKYFIMLILCGIFLLSCGNHSNPFLDDPDAPIEMKPDTFYQALLENFCNKYYHKKFPGRSYVPGSLRVDNVARLDDHNLVVMGTHTFKTGLGLLTYSDREFKATVREEDDERYHIRLDRRMEITHEWVSTGDLPFIYNETE